MGPKALLLALSVVLAGSPLSAAAGPVQYCGSPGISKQTLAKYDDEIRILSRDALIEAQEKHAPWGMPACQLRLFHPSYIGCYDTARRVPGWSAYRLEGADLRAAERARAKRKASFRTDPRLQPEQTATCGDYKKHYDLVTRGDPRKNYQARDHSAPDADFRSSERSQAYSYYLSNMTPQWQRFNGGIWATLERYTREWAKRHRAVHVFTGPIFDRDDDRQPDPPDAADRMRPTRRVAVATHYFKIIARETAAGQSRRWPFCSPTGALGGRPGTTEGPTNS